MEQTLSLADFLEQYHKQHPEDVSLFDASQGMSTLVVSDTSFTTSLYL